MHVKSSWLLLAACMILLVSCTPASTSTPITEDAVTATSLPGTVIPVETETTTPQPTTPPTTTSQPSPSSTVPTLLPSATPGSEVSQALKIAYIKDGAVNLWTEGGVSVTLTDSQDAAEVQLSDDGQLIAYRRQDPNDFTFQELWVVNTNGTPEPRVLVSKADLDEITPPDPDSYILGAGLLDFTWRPKTHEVAYNTYTLVEGPGSALHHDLRLVDSDSLEKTTLFDNDQDGLFYYSPDGNQIALSNPESISLVNADGSNLRPDVLTYPNVIIYSEYEYHPNPIWASDSGSLRVTIPPHDPLADPIPPTGLWSIPTDGSPAVLLGNINAMGFAWADNAFAPDLQHVVFVSVVGDPAANQRELHIASDDGTGDLVYDGGESVEFTGWSPDSQHFIYVINNGPNQGMYLGGIGEQPFLLSPEPHALRNIQWVDGSTYAYIFSTTSPWELHLGNLEGEDLGLIDTLPDSSPSFDVLP